MGAVAKAITEIIRFGGTGGVWVIPTFRDIVFNDPGVTHGSKVTPERAMGYIPFYAAVRNISEDIAGLPLNVYGRLPGGGRSRDAEHPVDRLLGSAANPYMSAFSFRETLQSHVLTWGNGYAEIEFADDGSVLALWPLRPDRMEVLIDRKLGHVFYRYALGSGGKVDLPRRNVLHVHGLGYDGLIGYSIVEKARSTLSMTLASEKYGENWYDKGGLPKAVLKHPKSLSDTAKTNLRESVEANYGTLEGRQRIMLLEEGMDIATLGVPAKDAAFLETMTSSRHLMATLFRMPPDMLQDVERSTSWGSGIEQQGNGYLRYTIRGHLARWEQEGNMRLLNGEDLYLKHITSAFMSGVASERWASYRQGLDLGVYSIDDVLEMEDRNPLPDGLGKQHFVQLNRAPLEQVGELSMADRLAALGGLVRAGFQPDAASDAVDLPAIDHTGLPPVTIQAKPALSVVKSAGWRCPTVLPNGDTCGAKLAVIEGSGTVVDCRRCKSTVIASGPQPVADPLASQDEMVERIAAKVIALMPRPEPAQVNFHDGAIRSEVHVPPTVIEKGAVAVTIEPPRPAVPTKTAPATVRKEVVRDAKGQITEVIERVE